ncbi:MAG: site-2 protease family protein [bacterium]|nr:site-2 protease family protein [bacterium]
MDQILILAFQVLVLLFSVIVHEVSHGFAALKLGDTTAKDMGRLTLNPIKHIDPFGSVILPIMLALIPGNSFILGWAKPVPYNPYNLKNPKLGAGLIGIAGPLSNLALAVVFSLIFRALLPFVDIPMIAVLAMLLQVIVATNISLAVFNLVPLPPLDGSTILFALLPARWYKLQELLTRYGVWLLIIFIFFGFQLITPIIGTAYHLLTGL